MDKENIHQESSQIDMNVLCNEPVPTDQCFNYHGSKANLNSHVYTQNFRIFCFRQPVAILRGKSQIPSAHPRAPLQAMNNTAGDMTKNKVTSIPRLHKPQHAQPAKPKGQQKAPEAKKKIAEGLEQVAALVDILYKEEEGYRQKVGDTKKQDRKVKEVTDKYEKLLKEHEVTKRQLQGTNEQLAEKTQHCDAQSAEVQRLTDDGRRFRAQLEALNMALTKQYVEKEEKGTSTTDFACEDGNQEDLEKQVSDLQFSLAGAKAENHHLQTLLSQQRVRYDDLRSSIENGKDRESSLTLEVEAFSSIVRAQEQEMEKRQDEYQEQIINLQRTLDSRESDIDVLTQERDELRAKNEENADVTEKLQWVLKQKMLIQQQLKLAQSSAKEAEEFLQLEQSSLKDDLNDLRQEHDHTKMELARCQQENLVLQSQVEESEQKQKQLQEELDVTKEQARNLLLEQGGEITMAIESIARLRSSLLMLARGLESKADEWKQQIPEAEPTSPDSKPVDNVPSPSSTTSPSPPADSDLQTDMPPGGFINSIMDAINNIDEQLHSLVEAKDNSNIEVAADDDIRVTGTAVTGSDGRASDAEVDGHGEARSAFTQVKLPRTPEPLRLSMSRCSHASEELQHTPRAFRRIQKTSPATATATAVTCDLDCSVSLLHACECNHVDRDSPVTSSQSSLVLEPANLAPEHTNQISNHSTRPVPNQEIVLDNFYEESEQMVSAFTRVPRSTSEERNAESSSDEESQNTPLNEMIDALHAVVHSMVMSMETIETGVRHTCLKWEMDMDQLKTTMENERVSHLRSEKTNQDHVDELEEEVRHLVTKERDATRQLEELRQVTRNRENELCRLQDLVDTKNETQKLRSEQQIQIQKMERELTQLNRNFVDKEAERKATQESLNLALSRLERVEVERGGTGAESQLIRENYILKKDLTRIRTKMFERQEDSQRQISKLSRHNKILKINCDKADAELAQLDTLVENMIVVVKEHVSDPKSPSAIQKELQELGIDIDK